MTRDKEAHLAGCQTVVSHFLVVVEACHDGLSGTTGVRSDKTPNFLLHPFKPCLFLTALSSVPRHGVNIAVNGYERIVG